MRWFFFMSMFHLKVTQAQDRTHRDSRERETERALIQFTIKWKPPLVFHWLIQNGGSFSYAVVQTEWGRSDLITARSSHVNTCTRTYRQNTSQIHTTQICRIICPSRCSVSFPLVPIPPSPIHLFPVSYPSHPSLSCTLPHACLPTFSFLSIVSGSLLIICDLLKYIHRFTLLFYAACFLPRSQRVLSFIITLALLHPPLAPWLFFLFLSLLPRMPHTLYLSFMVRSKVLSQFSFYTETDNRRHSSSCPHSVIWGKSSLMFLWTKIRLLLWITQYSTAIWHRLPRHCISIQLGSHGARSDIKSQLYISVEQTPAALRIVQSDLSFEALRWAS